MKFNRKVILFDTETTGTTESDEILQLSIINGKGRVLFNKYIKPYQKTSWPYTEKINGITPEKVSKCKTFDKYQKKIQKIFDKSEVLIAYNFDFDSRFLRQSGIRIDRIKKVLDPMIDFAEIYCKRKSYYCERKSYNDLFKWQKLVTAAKYYGYEFKAHDALEDIKATLFVARKIYEKK